MVVEQEEMMEEDDITHQPSQEEEIPREPRQGVQMYDQDLSSYGYSALKSLHVAFVFMAITNCWL